ncbi:unnamed protein product [Moneuplotes crassus]|uniref:RanBP-type and C3HC4-type zinc finger-containing protein 1 n=1 Tax=Euplotes crassus TaxID=5936 RepID=A0AAD1X2Z7_EUPCR|nr:unnamed protein product [Moneuplotes crassus]
MECPICLRDWSMTLVPLIIQCGHSYCKECIGQLVKNGNMNCCICKEDNKFTALSDLEINLTFLKRSHYLPENPGSEYLSKKLNIEIFKDYRCLDHDAPVHSYCPDTMEVFCCKCENDNNEEAKNVTRIPEVVHQLKTCLNSQRLKNKQASLQMKFAEKVLEAQLEKSKMDNLQKIEEHYDNLQKLLEQRRQQAKKEYLDKFEDYFKSLDCFETIKQVRKHLAEVEHLINDKDKGKIGDYCQSCIELSNLKNEVNLADFDAPKEILMFEPEVSQNETSGAEYTSVNYTIELKPYKFNAVQDSIDITKCWYCHHCETQNSSITNCLSCSGCLTPRPIEYYESFFKNYRYASLDDFKLLEERQKSEEELINSLKKPSYKDKVCYVINESWLIFWDHYITQKKKAYNLQTDEESLINNYVPHPGQINNHILVRKPKEGQEAVAKYKDVNPRVWNAFYQIYGGGPKVHKRNKKDSKLSMRPLQDPYEAEFNAKIEKIKKKNSLLGKAKPKNPLHQRPRTGIRHRVKGASAGISERHLTKRTNASKKDMTF